MAVQQKDSKNLCIGVAVGTFLVALCCFTPVLVTVLGLVGLGVLTPYLDYVLLPALVVLIVVTVLAYRRWKHASISYDTSSQEARC